MQIPQKTESEQAKPLIEYFKSVRNQPELTTPFRSQTARQNDRMIWTLTPSEEEITKAIKTMKPGKAAGVYGIQAELMKVDISKASDELH